MDKISNYYGHIIIVMFILFAAFEMLIPLRKHQTKLKFRWTVNLALTLLSFLMFKLTGPLLAIVTATLFEHMELGLLNRINITSWSALLIGIIILDAKQYVFHRLMHYFDILWCVHRVHHSDIELDVTSGFRFHPLEALLSYIANLLAIAIFGISPEAIVISLILVYFTNFFGHGNIQLPEKLDFYMKCIFVTPSMHHLHHAMHKTAAHSNFGVLLSVWDRLFGTYLAEHPDSQIYPYGLPDYREMSKLGIWTLLLMPFKSTSIKQKQNIS